MWYSTVGLIVTLTLSMLVVPLVADAEQTGQAARIGVLSPYTPPAEAASLLLDVLRQALREQGWVEGQNLTIEQRHAGGQYEQLPALAAELIRLPVDVIIANTTAAAQAA